MSEDRIEVEKVLPGNFPRLSSSGWLPSVVLNCVRHGLLRAYRASMMRSSQMRDHRGATNPRTIIAGSCQEETFSYFLYDPLT